MATVVVGRTSRCSNGVGPTNESDSFPLWPGIGRESKSREKTQTEEERAMVHINCRAAEAMTGTCCSLMLPPARRSSNNGKQLGNVHGCMMNCWLWREQPPRPPGVKRQAAQMVYKRKSITYWPAAPVRAQQLLSEPSFFSSFKTAPVIFL